MSKHKVKSANQPYKEWHTGYLPFIRSWQKIVLVMTLAIASAITAIWFVNQNYTETLKDRARTFAYSISADRVETLSDLTLPDTIVSYDTVKKRLADLKSVYSDTRFVYIMDQKGSVIRFLADSEPVNSPGYSPRGQVYDAATPLLQSLFTSGQAAVEGPVSDEWGIWYSALAPIKNGKGQTIGVLGVDVPASRYLYSATTLGIVIILAGIVASIIIYFYDRTRDRRLTALRFQIELMSIASHELRSPLSGIRWGQEVLLQSELNDTQRTVIKAVYDSTLQLQESIEDILQLAAIGSMTPKKQIRTPVDLAQILSDVVTFQALSAQEKELKVVYADSWQPPLMTLGDGNQLRRVFNNILSNAIKYSSIGNDITVSYEGNEERHLIIIKNRGIGVPHKELRHIFDGFYRATNAVQQQVNGSGMGLFLSRRTIEQHGGRLWLESVENESTTAFVELPIMPQESAKTPKPDPDKTDTPSNSASA